MIQHILCVSYDNRLLLARRTLLEQNGYNVTPALGFKESMARCEAGGLDLLILGHSIPHSGKERLMQRFRRGNSAPILALWRADERVLDTANYLTSGINQRLWFMFGRLISIAHFSNEKHRLCCRGLDLLLEPHSSAVAHCAIPLAAIRSRWMVQRHLLARRTWHIHQRTE